MGLILTIQGQFTDHQRIAHTLSIMEILELFATESLAVAWFERVRWQGVHVFPLRQHGTDVRQPCSIRARPPLFSSRREPG